MLKYCSVDHTGRCSGVNYCDMMISSSTAEKNAICVQSCHRKNFDVMTLIDFMSNSIMKDKLKISTLKPGLIHLQGMSDTRY